MFAIVKTGGKQYKIKENDIILVEKLSNKKGDSIKKYIKRAGGYSAFAETSDVVIIYPNGTAIPKSGWSSPKVIEGSTIIVNQRTISGSSDRVTGIEIFNAISSQAGNMATTLLTLMRLINQSSGTSGK